MDTSEEDLAARGRSIFDQLRADVEAAGSGEGKLEGGLPAPQRVEPEAEDPTGLTVPDAGIDEATTEGSVAPAAEPHSGEAVGEPGDRVPGPSEELHDGDPVVSGPGGQAPATSAPVEAAPQGFADPPPAAIAPIAHPATLPADDAVELQEPVFHVEPSPGSAMQAPVAPGSGGGPMSEGSADRGGPPDPAETAEDDPLFHVEPPAALAAAVEITPDLPPPLSDGPVFHVEPRAGTDDAGTHTADPANPPVPGSVRGDTEVTAAAGGVPLPPRPLRSLPRTLAVANQKGGVGKTTTAVNLGAALAEIGYRTLVVDLDPQGNATTGLGINARTLNTSVYDVLMRELPVEDAVEPTSVRNLFVVPATIDLAGAEIELVPAFSRELRLKRALEGVADDFDFTLIDCPPSLGLLTVNALAAATEVIVPVQCEYYALEGLSALLRNVQLVQTNLNRALEMSTIVLTMYDARTKLAEQVANEVRTHFGNVVCRQVVPRTVRLSEAPSFGQPIIVFDPTSRGAIAYRELAKEVSGGAPQRVG